MASIYSNYGTLFENSARIRVDYSYTQNQANNTTTVNASLYYLAGTVDGATSASGLNGWITIAGQTFPLAISTQTAPYSGRYIGSCQKTINHNLDGSISPVYIQGYGSDINQYTNNTNIGIPSINRAATIAWMDNFTVGNGYINVGINNPNNYNIIAFLYVNGQADIVIKGDITGTFTWNLTVAECEAILNAMNGKSTSGTTIFIASYLGDTHIGTTSFDGVCYRPDASQVSLSKNNFNISEDITVFSGRATGNYFRHNIYLSYGPIVTKLLVTDVNAGWAWDTDASIDLYSQIPNANYGIGSIVENTYIGSVYIGQTSIPFTCNVINSNPTFTNFTYVDTNATTIALTGSPTKIIKGYSNVKATISTANKAVAKNSATMSKYTFKNGTKPQVDGNYSSTAAVDITMNTVDNNTLEIYAIDSRGNSTKKEILASTFLDYFPISLPTVTAVRGTGGIGSAVTLAFNGAIWNKTFGSIANSVVSCIYKYKKTTDTVWITGTTVITPTLSGDIYSKSVSIAGDLGATGFDINHSYNIQVIITDKLSTYTQNIILQSGTPQLAFGIGVGVAIGAFYNATIGGLFQIGGALISYFRGLCTNFNTALTQGVHKISSATSLTGAPYIGAIYGKLFVEVDDNTTHNNSTNTVWQVFKNTVGNEYRRCKVNSGVWGLWENESNLVYDYIVPTAVSSITIPNLDLLRDGGIYDVEITGNSNLSNAVYLNCRFNGLITGYYSKLMVYSTTMQIINNINETSCRIAVLEQNSKIASTSKSTITLEQYTVIDTRSVGVNSEFFYNRTNDINQIFEKYMSTLYNGTALNLISMYLFLDSGLINAGTRIRIYKRPQKI